MPHLIESHLFEDGATARIVGAETPKMIAQVGFNLFFGLGDEPKTIAIAKGARDGAQGKGAQVPQGVQEAGSSAQFLQALLARWSPRPSG